MFERVLLFVSSLFWIVLFFLAHQSTKQSLIPKNKNSSSGGAELQWGWLTPLNFQKKKKTLELYKLLALFNKNFKHPLIWHPWVEILAPFQNLLFEHITEMSIIFTSKILKFIFHIIKNRKKNPYTKLNMQLRNTYPTKQTVNLTVMMVMVSTKKKFILTNRLSSCYKNLNSLH